VKKIGLLIALTVISFYTQAQSFEVGFRYLGISNWFFNGNVSNGNSYVVENYQGVYSYAYGLQLAYNFTDHTGIETDIMLAKLSQTYNGSFNTNGVLPEGPQYKEDEEFNSNVAAKITQIPIFFRYLYGNGQYMAIGPEIGIVTDANYSITYTGAPPNSPSTANYDVANYFASTYIAGVISFGNNIRLSHQLFFNINLRVSYDFSDLKGVDAVGQNLNGDLYSGSSPFYSGYKATHAASASFGLALIYRFGHDF